MTSIFTPDIKYLNLPSLNIPIEVCSFLHWFPLLVPLEPSTCSRWRFLVVLTRACVQTVPVVPPGVGDRRNVLPWREHRSTVHLALQVSNVVTNVCHQQEQEIEGAWRTLRVTQNKKKSFYCSVFKGTLHLIER